MEKIWAQKVTSLVFLFSQIKILLKTGQEMEINKYIYLAKEGENCHHHQNITENVHNHKPRLKRLSGEKVQEKF